MSSNIVLRLWVVIRSDTRSACSSATVVNRNSITNTSNACYVDCVPVVTNDAPTAEPCVSAVCTIVRRSYTDSLTI